MGSKQLSVSEILSGALALLQTGPRGGKLHKARWTTGIAHNKDADTYCALGALSKVALRTATDLPHRFTDTLGKAAKLVVKHIPKSYKCYTISDIPGWNDQLSDTRGFTSIKRVFCNALKESLVNERKRHAK